MKGHKKGHDTENELIDGKTRMWLSNDTFTYINDIQERLKPIHKYEIVEYCVKYFKEKGYDPRTYSDDLPAVALQTLRADLMKSNTDVKDQFVKFIRTHEKNFLNPVVVKLETAVNLLVEHLRQDNASNSFDSNLKNEKTEKTLDWLSKIKNDIVPKVENNINNEIAIKDNSKEIEELKIQLKRKENEYNYLKEKFEFVRSRIENKKGVFSSTDSYVLKIDDVEYNDLIQYVC